MHYKILKTANSEIEIHNNWLGVEKVRVNGQIVSKKFSLIGSNHYFSIFEDGQSIPYVLSTKMIDLSVFVDFRRDGILINENIPIKFGIVKSNKENNVHKIAGIKLLSEFDTIQVILQLEKALEFDKHDPEIYFHLACCYSIEEKKEEGYKYIKKAIEFNLSHPQIILNHEMLSYLRIQESFQVHIPELLTP